MKLPYFKLKEAFNEARDSSSYGSNTDKVSSVAKFFGKSIANTGIAVTKITVKTIE